MESRLHTHIAQSAEAMVTLASDPGCLGVLAEMADVLTGLLRAGGKVLLAGNGGSAADAQHLAAEFVSRLMRDRSPLAALALTESGPILTACANDYGIDSIFARQVDALGRPGDALILLSTSGNSTNLLSAADAGNRRKATVLAFSGQVGGRLADVCPLTFRAPSPHAQVVQQLHVAAGHALLAEIEQRLFP